MLLSLCWVTSTAMSSPTRFSHEPVVRAKADGVGWGLAVLSETSKLSTPVTEDSYSFFPDSGKGVDVYVIDSGINPIKGLEGIIIQNEFTCKGSDSSDKRDHGMYSGWQKAFPVSRGSLMCLGFYALPPIRAVFLGWMLYLLSIAM